MTDSNDADSTNRRTALRLAAGGLAAGLAGCLSNPWKPGGERARRENPGAAGGDDSSDGDEESVESSDGGNESAGGDEESGDTTAEADLVVEVAPDGFQFAPSSFEIESGDTVRWVWRAGGHNLRVRSEPDGSSWDGTPGSASDTYGEGYEHVHTFEAPGDYEYFCAPHQTLGLEGRFTVR